MFRLSGVVSCCGGFAVENATVAIAGVSALTDSRGRFTLGYIPGGTYILTVLQRNYEVYRKKMFIDRDQENVFITLDKTGLL